MVGNPDGDRPYSYECQLCDHRVEAYGPAVCPNCGEEMKNLSRPSANRNRTGLTY